jgi:hypothetical protein
MSSLFVFANLALRENNIRNRPHKREQSKQVYFK